MKKLFLNILFLSISIHSTCQELDLSSYLSNVVSIGGGDFGIITGEVDSYTLSFVTVGDVDSNFFNGISVKFHNTEAESTAFLVKKFTYGKYIIALYECEKPEKLVWRTDHYDFFSLNSTSYKTFLDNGKNDNQWSNYRDPVSMINLSNGIANLRMETQPIYSRGMPVLNDRGSIVGMIASRQSAEDHIIFEAIDFSIFETLLFDFGKCDYFTLIRFGQTTTMCNENNDILKAEVVDSKIIHREKSIFTVAPAINPGLFLLPGLQKEFGLRGYGSTIGINLTFWSHEVRRLTVKPRYGLADVWFSSLSMNKVHGFHGMRLKYLEVPLLIEFELDNYFEDNYIISFGYVPTFQFDPDLIFFINTKRFNYHVNSKTDFNSKLLVELIYEKRRSRWSLVYWAQLNRWDDSDFEFTTQSTVIQPFGGHRSVSHFIGIEFSTRIWAGNWLRKGG